MCLICINFNRYYYCPPIEGTADRGQPIANECPTGYAFDPSLADVFPCRYISTNTAYCITVNCTGAGTKILGYQYLPSNLALGQVAAYCLGKDETPFMYRCGANSEFKGVDMAGKWGPICQAKCASEGQKLIDSTNDNKYYVCYRDGSVYSTKSYTCPSQYTFDAKQGSCVRGDSAILVLLKQISDKIDANPPTTTTTTTTTTPAPGR